MRAAHLQHQRPHVVDAVRVVGMRMGQHDRVEPVDVRVASNCSRRSGDVSTRTRSCRRRGRPLDQDRAAPAAVRGSAGIAGAPALPDARHAARRAAAQDREPSASCRLGPALGGILSNSRTTLARRRGREARHGPRP